MIIKTLKYLNSRSPPCLWNENRASWELARWRRRRQNSERSSRLSTKNRTCQRLSTNIREETTSLTKEPQKLKPMQNGCHIGCCKRVKPINIIEASWKEENKLKMFQEDLRRFGTCAIKVPWLEKKASLDNPASLTRISPHLKMTKKHCPCDLKSSALWF